jgi:hypothetical protein
MRVEDFKKTVEERKTYVEQVLVGLTQKHEYKHNLVFGNGGLVYKKLMDENKGMLFEDTKEGKQLDKLFIARKNRENELKAIEAYLRVIK